MNLRRTRIVLLACIGAALLIGAPSASAKPGYFVMSGHQSVTLSLKGSNGYRISISKQGRYVYLQASQEDRAAGYLVRSPAEGDAIKARFPGVGRVSMRFQPQAPPREVEQDPFPGCKGGELVKQQGYFVGVIRFRGERGYTSANATRVRATKETRAKEVCKRFEDDGPEPETDRTEFFASSRSGGRLVAFDASRTEISDLTTPTTFGAFAAERRRGMAISRFVFADSREKGIVAGDTRPHPLSGTFTPPAPFQGSGEFQRDAEGNSTWTGSLTVQLPGLGPVALTGPEFTAKFCQRSGCTGSSIDGYGLPWIATGRDRFRAP